MLTDVEWHRIAFVVCKVSPYTCLSSQPIVPIALIMILTICIIINNKLTTAISLG